MTIELRLRDGLQSMQIQLSEEKIQTLLLYLQELHKWNQVYNLSAIRDPEVMVTRHLLDSLALFPFLETYIQLKQVPIHLIDVGTGGGLPGVPLAIAFPNIRVTLLDSNGKKTRFLFQTSIKLGLKNIQVENNRVEHFSPANKFDIVTSRAFASLLDMVQGARHLLGEDGQFWAMKGQYPQEELAECESMIDVINIHKLSIPHSEGERHLLMLKLNHS